MCQFLKISIPDPLKGFFSKSPTHPSRNSNQASHISLNFLVLQKPLPPLGNSIPSVAGGEGVWIFSGPVQFQLNKTMHFSVKIYNIFIYQFFYSTAYFSFKGFRHKFCHGRLKQKNNKSNICELNDREGELERKIFGSIMLIKA